GSSCSRDVNREASSSRRCCFRGAGTGQRRILAFVLAAGAAATHSTGLSGCRETGSAFSPLSSRTGAADPAVFSSARRDLGVTRRFSSETSEGGPESCESLASLDEAIAKTAKGSPNVLIVSFSTTWCGPCKLMDPKVKELSQIFSEKATFIKVLGDVAGTEGIQIMKREGIRTVPLYQIYKDGEKVSSISGADAEALTRNIELHTGMSAK
ncbi:unnamed protein product, partial [Polarella glacialis]